MATVYEPPPLGIGVDGLAVAEVDDDEQGHDGRADRDDVVDAHQAQRDEQGERGFRAVSGGAEGIEAEDGDAGEGPMCSARSSLVASGRPKSRFSAFVEMAMGGLSGDGEIGLEESRRGNCLMARPEESEWVIAGFGGRRDFPRTFFRSNFDICCS